MERANILSTQKEEMKGWKEDFVVQASDEGMYYLFKGDMSAQRYCEFMRLDYPTVSRLGEIRYSIEYAKVDNLYVLTCGTYINDVKSEPLSVAYEDNEDWLGLYTIEDKADEGKLPSNWRELLTDEDKEEIAKDWCEHNSEELRDYLSSEDERDIAYDYAHDNPSDIGDEVCGYLGSSDSRDLIIKLLDNI